MNPTSQNPTSTQWHRMPITGGINAYTSEDQLQGEVVDSSNFLFEGGECRTRPGVQAQAINGLSGRVIYGAIFPVLGNLIGNGIFITDDNKLWQFFIPPSGSPPALVNNVAAFVTPITSVPINADAVNGDVLIAGIATTLTRYILGGISALLPDAPYGYVCSHFSRAIGAYNTGGSFTNNVTFGWSASGDVTNWTTLDSGSFALADAIDRITGLGTINNVVVLLRNRGIHLATLTGTAPPVGPVFRAEPYIRIGAGCFYPGTAAFFDNRCFFVGYDNVYMFDLQQVKPIGDKIKDRLLPVLNATYGTGLQVGYTGFVSCDSLIYSNQAPATSPLGNIGCVTNVRPRFRYHLVPAPETVKATRNQLTNPLPHFVYDPFEDKWSVHNYNFATSTGMDMNGPVVFDTASPSNMYAWDQTLPQEASAFLAGGTTIMENEPERDFSVARTLIRYRNNGPQDNVRVTVNASRGDKLASVSDAEPLGTIEPDGRWLRQYFNTPVVGQDFQWRIDVPPLDKFSTDYISFRYGSAGEFKGVIPDQGQQGVSSRGANEIVT